MRFFKLFFPVTLLCSGIAIGLWQHVQGGLDTLHVTIILLLGLLGLQSIMLLKRQHLTLQHQTLRESDQSLFTPVLTPSSVDSSATENILEALAGGVLTVDEDGTVLYVNDSAEKLISIRHAIGKHLNDVIVLEDTNGKALNQRVMEMHRSRPQHLIHFGKIRLFTLPKEGEGRLVELYTTHLYDQEHTLVFIFRDVTAGRKVINRLYQQASHDALTGLMNRRSFEEYLEQVAHDDNPAIRHHMLVSLDLDNFKIVNDTCGHQAGDELLKQVAQILQRSVRNSDKVARMGGDEFAILLESCGVEKGRKLMDSILLKLRNHRFSWDSKIFGVTASMGLLEFVPKPEVYTRTLFADADKACYTAKALGRNQTFVHIHSEDVPYAEQENTDWAKLLETALERDRFILFVQPIVPLQRNRHYPHAHYEVLLRLPFRKSLLSPGSFLPAADRLDMMSRIDRWIIRKVLETVAQTDMSTRAGDDLRLMINLSAQAVQDTELFSYIEEQIKLYGINPTLLCFEIPESVAVANFMQAKLLMRSLHALGCHLVLDDFGSGFSSLNYVRDLPLSYLKIDGNFVHNLVANPVDAAMIKAVHEVGQVMNLFTIAELVEDGETLDSLYEIGVDFAQGYHCGKPFPFDELGTANKHLISNQASHTA